MKDISKSEALLKYNFEVIQCLKNLDAEDRNIIKSAVLDTNQDMLEYMDEAKSLLEQKDFYLLIAGKILQEKIK